MKNKVLLIFPPLRIDTYSYFSSDLQNDYYLLYYENEEKTQYSPFIKDQYFWSDYKNSEDLLASIKPDVIIFWEVYDYKQIALIITANFKKIKTIYLSHGAYSPLQDYILNGIKQIKGIKKNKLFRLFSEAKTIAKSRLFYYHSAKFLPFTALLKLIKFDVYTVLKYNSIALNKVFLKEKNAKINLLFNLNNKEHFQYLYHVADDKINYVGVPYFDFFYSKSTTLEKEVVYIEHPYYEMDRYGWCKDYHYKVAKKLYDFAKKNKIIINVKLHPKSNIGLWKKYNFECDFFKIFQFEDCTSIYLKSELILSFSSSMIVGFLSAKKNVVLLTWSPSGSLNRLDDTFNSLDLCHKSNKVEDLDIYYESWLIDNKCLINKNKYISFIRKFNYPFDGRASKRIIEHIGI